MPSRVRRQKAPGRKWRTGCKANTSFRLKTADVRKVYEGLPVTSVALILPLIYSFHKDIGHDCFPMVYGGALIVIAIAFITRFKVKKPGIRTMFGFLGIGVLELIWLMYKTKMK